MYFLYLMAAQLLTGEIPFGNSASDHDVVMQVIKGTHNRPTNYNGIACEVDDQMWALMLDCWDMEPSKRPRMRRVISRLLDVSVPTRAREDGAVGDKGTGTQTSKGLSNEVVGYSALTSGSDETDECDPFAYMPLSWRVVRN